MTGDDHHLDDGDDGDNNGKDDDDDHGADGDEDGFALESPPQMVPLSYSMMILVLPLHLSETRVQVGLLDFQKVFLCCALPLKELRKNSWK